MTLSTNFMVLLTNAALLTSGLQYGCSRTEYERCVKMADPLVKEAHLIFPDNVNDIDVVCRTWNNFVDCLKRYTDMCFTNQQRIQFNKAIESPIESVHQMCMQPNYQKEYLQYAPCMKATVVDRYRCGPHYDLLVDQVEQGDIISKATLCCSHDRFKQCVLKKTREICDNGAPDGPASHFSTQIIDKALGFLQDQCYNYIPNSGDCTSISTTSSDQFISTPSQVYPWSAVHAKEIPPTRITPPKVTSWLPSSSVPDPSRPYESPAATQTLGSRTRPASYGRASSWADTSDVPSTPPVKQQTVEGFVRPTAAVRPPGATVSTWTVVDPSPGIEKAIKTYETNAAAAPEPTYTSSTTWYPAAGNQLSNEVDEPNQMGLVKPEDNSTVTHNIVASLLIVAVLTTFGL